MNNKNTKTNEKNKFRYFDRFVLPFPCAFSQVRSEFLLEKNWKFTREDSPEFINPTFNDSKWQSVTVPHDWAIYGPFSSQNDKQEVAIAQDGQTEAMEHAGRTGGLPSWSRLVPDRV